MEGAFAARSEVAAAGFAIQCLGQVQPSCSVDIRALFQQGLKGCPTVSIALEQVLGGSVWRGPSAAAASTAA
jgi:hypothetical protein